MRPTIEFAGTETKMRTTKFLVTVLIGFLLAGTSDAATSEVADAAMKGDAVAVRALLARKADVNTPQTDGTTALHWAVYRENVALVDELLRAGAKTAVANREGATPLYLAGVAGNPVIIDKLLKSGVDVNGTILRHGETPLMFSARTGHPDVVKLFLEAGAKVDAKDTLRQTTALMWAAEQGHAEVVKLLVAAGADVNAQTTIDGAKKRRGVVYKQGEDFHTGGVTPLILAARQGNLDAVKALAEGGADLNKGAGDESTAMLVAIQNGHYNVARYLVEKGANIKPNEKGWTPLYYLAVKHRNLETGTIPVPNQNQAFDFIKLLLERNVDNMVRRRWRYRVHARGALWRLRSDENAPGERGRSEDRHGRQDHRVDGGVRRRLHGRVHPVPLEGGFDCGGKTLAGARCRRERSERGWPHRTAWCRAQGGARRNQVARRPWGQP
jgi:ankyrin repeat protein